MTGSQVDPHPAMSAERIAELRSILGPNRPGVVSQRAVARGIAHEALNEIERERARSAVVPEVDPHPARRVAEWFFIEGVRYDGRVILAEIESLRARSAVVRPTRDQIADVIAKSLKADGGYETQYADAQARFAAAALLAEFWPVAVSDSQETPTL